jgi:hypothetical protein
MTWLMEILKFVLKLIIPTIIAEIVEYLKDGKEMSDWKNSEWAKIEKAANKFKEEMKEAGNDEQAQKDAFDKLLNSSR